MTTLDRPQVSSVATLQTKHQPAKTPMVAQLAKSRALPSATLDAGPAGSSLRDAAAERLVSLAAEQWFLVRS